MAEACIRCGGPRPTGALKYCPACRRKVKAERDKAGRWKQYIQEKAELEAEKALPPYRPRRKKLTPEEREAAARARSTNGFIDADICKCIGCYYWRRLGSTCMACHYPIDTGELRPMWPKDCYQHEGTPYRPACKEV